MRRGSLWGLLLSALMMTTACICAQSFIQKGGSEFKAGLSYYLPKRDLKLTVSRQKITDEDVATAVKASIGKQAEADEAKKAAAIAESGAADAEALAEQAEKNKITGTELATLTNSARLLRAKANVAKAKADALQTVVDGLVKKIAELIAGKGKDPVTMISLDVMPYSADT